MVNTMSDDSEYKPNTNQTSQKTEDVAKDMAQKTYGDFLGAYKSFSETTSKVVQQAASILESEIAAGRRQNCTANRKQVSSSRQIPL